MARIDFDPNAQPANEALDPLPSGWYAAQIVASEMKQSKSSSGQYLQLNFELLEQYHPQHKGRKAFERLNLINDNATVVSIARGDLTKICQSLMMMQVVSDSELLHHKPIAIKLKIRPASGEYAPSNEICGYDSIANRIPNAQPSTVQPAVTPGVAPAQALAQAATTPTGAPPAGGIPPWQR